VICETVSAKGQLQFIDLANVDTMMPLGSQSRGCLVKNCKKDSSIEKDWTDGLQKSLSHGFINNEGYEALNHSWELFSKTYKEALQEFWDIGFESSAVMKIEDTYVA